VTLGSRLSLLWRMAASWFGRLTRAVSRVLNWICLIFSRGSETERQEPSTLTKLPVLSPLSPLGSILSDIERAIEAHLYYPALLAALTLPEICTALTLDRSVFVKDKHYIAFVDKYADGLGLTGAQCYQLRGGVVHRANLAGHPFFDSSHVIFTLPETKNRSGTRIGIHALTLQSGESRAATFDLTKFCEVMIAAVRKWYEDHQNDAKVAANMGALIRYCPNGLAPFFVGAPIVASGK
jgi:hypothetical protein